MKTLKIRNYMMVLKKGRAYASVWLVWDRFAPMACRELIDIEKFVEKSEEQTKHPRSEKTIKYYLF